MTYEVKDVKVRKDRQPFFALSFIHTYKTPRPVSSVLNISSLTIWTIFQPLFLKLCYHSVTLHTVNPFLAVKRSLNMSYCSWWDVTD